MSVDLAPAHVALCLALGLVALPRSETRRLARSGFLGLVLPAALLAGGVAVVVVTRDGAEALAALTALATPVLAACSGFVLRWRHPCAVAVAAAGLYVVAWRLDPTLLGQAAGVLLIAGACLTIAALVRSLASARALIAGVALLALIDVALVWGDGEMARTMASLGSVAPSGMLSDGAGPSLPALQAVALGGSVMGWLDVLAPALVGTLLPASRPTRVAAAASIFVATLGWGLLHAFAPLIPATVPSLAGLAPMSVRWLVDRSVGRPTA